MATLTAGQSSSFKGFAAVGNAIGLPTFGSFDTAPFAGVTTQYIYTTDGTNGSIGLTGNQSPSFFGGQIYVDGVAWAVTYTAYDGTHTSYSLTPANGTGFVNATNYNVSLTSAPVDPNITSAAAVTNLVNTTLAHTITADKTIASTAIIGGADAAAFEINGTNQLRFASNAASSALGSLVVQIQITDNDGLTDTQTITVTVKAIVFKGIKFYSRAGATSTAPVILTDFSNPLTGANSIAAAIGDTIVAFPAIGSTADRDMIVNTGYAEHADHYVNGTTYDANIGLFTKKLTATETSLTIGSSGSANDAQAMILMLFQGVDATTPMDVSVVLDQGTGTGKPNPAAITPTTTGAVGIFGGAQAAATAVALTSSDLTAFTQRVQADTNDIGVGAGFIEWSGSGAIDPAVFGGGASNAANSWATISAVLRPAWTGGGTPSVTVNGAAHTHTASSPSLAAKSSVTPNSAASDHAASSPSLAAKSTLTPASAAHTNVASSPTISGQSSIAPESAAHVSTATSPTVGTPVAISPDSAVSATTSTEATIAAKASIAPDSTAHAHTASSPTITTANSVAPDSAAHDQAASQPTLATNNQVAPDSAAHVLATMGPGISTSGSVAVAVAAHDHAATSPTIEARSAVEPDQAVHDLVSASPTLGAANSVQPNGSSHAQIAASAVVATRSAVVIDSIHHATVSGEPGLSASVAISVDAVAHQTIATAPSLGSIAAIQVHGAHHDVESPIALISIETLIPRSRRAKTEAARLHASTVNYLRLARGAVAGSRSASTKSGKRAV